MTDELKPCPFCGHADGLDHWEKTEDWEADLMWVSCSHCDMTISSNTGFGADTWNTRPIEDALRAEIETLEFILSGYTELGIKEEEV